MERHERIALAIKRSGKKNGQIAEECDVTASAVSQWKSGLTQAIKPENLAALAKATGTTMEWLATGEGDMPAIATGVQTEGGGPATGYDADSANTVRTDSKIRTRRLPLIGWEQVGKIGVSPMEDIDISEFMDWAYPSESTDFLVELSTESMLPEFRPGERVQISQKELPKHGSYVAVVFPSGKATFRRLLDGEDGRILEALNQHWPNRLMPFPDGARIVGVAVASWMNRRI